MHITFLYLYTLYCILDLEEIIQCSQHLIQYFVQIRQRIINNFVKFSVNIMSPPHRSILLSHQYPSKNHGQLIIQPLINHKF